MEEKEDIIKILVNEVNKENVSRYSKAVASALLIVLSDKDNGNKQLYKEVEDLIFNVTKKLSDKINLLSNGSNNSEFGDSSSDLVESLKTLKRELVTEISSLKKIKESIDTRDDSKIIEAIKKINSEIKEIKEFNNNINQSSSVDEEHFDEFETKLKKLISGFDERVSQKVKTIEEIELFSKSIQTPDYSTEIENALVKLKEERQSFENDKKNLFNEIKNDYFNKLERLEKDIKKFSETKAKDEEIEDIIPKKAINSSKISIGTLIVVGGLIVLGVSKFVLNVNFSEILSKMF